MPEVTIPKEEYRVMLQDQTMPQFLRDNGFNFKVMADIKRTEEFGKIIFKQEDK